MPFSMSDIPTYVLIGALGTAAKFYGDTTYLLVADSLQGQYFQLQRDIKQLELQPDKTPEENAYLQFLRLQADQLEEKLE